MCAGHHHHHHHHHYHMLGEHQRLLVLLLLHFLPPCLPLSQACTNCASTHSLRSALIPDLTKGDRVSSLDRL
ncbi:uncharacterized protein BP01DRAFT_38884 [Aspergillus saccharolyticus JOP 1030-1]|uniref:Secreted protein n=1 Tax=Aspergillus saccharolyticus JOP 1030-1 TaxID=1450539 RepID=A0A319A0E5_9EURO|nr:hypothetical protein BP01DRAFT_38884 [Aspergillus saccharolyticus JOP 1030-1]PYH45768.1 hypothetical protein BP01DRAFT_38884 [Aspergillus saccharolyticus JOP 1030-1]